MIDWIHHDSVTTANPPLPFEQYLKSVKKPQTNADRIRAMTDKELARFQAGGCEVAGLECRVARDPLFPADEHLEDCEDCWMNWLKKEVGNG